MYEHTRKIELTMELILVTGAKYFPHIRVRGSSLLHGKRKINYRLLRMDDTDRDRNFRRTSQVVSTERLSQRRFLLFCAYCPFRQNESDQILPLRRG